MPRQSLERWAPRWRRFWPTKPEAVYFFADDEGNRTGSIVFDLKDTSQIPAVAEPWFLAFNAKVTLRPVMTPQDLAKARPAIAKLLSSLGSSECSAANAAAITEKPGIQPGFLVVSIQTNA
jgi:hypothetical protein